MGRWGELSLKYRFKHRFEPNQNVKGVIITLEDDKKIQRALSVTHNIKFYRYDVKFKLFKG